ncbi:MAG TPA: endonuclease/exonuclease/phosphatase family protein [Acetobacteraceae bacterium]
MRFILLLVVVVIGTSDGFARELKLATWNLEWLTDRAAGDPELPADVVARRPGDVALLAHYAAELNADVIAIQEVDGPAIAARVFPPDSYAIHMTDDDVIQRVGLVVRRGIDFTANPDVTGLDPSPLHLRSGADITVHLAAGPLRILAVHLKTGCRESPLVHSRRRACRELAEQVPALTAWIEARRAEQVPFVVMGDFNRWMDDYKGRADALWSVLREAAPLTRATEGFASPCWGGEHFIDHIIAGGRASNWLEARTLHVLVFRETGDEWKERLSDHCAVSVRFQVPD